MIVALVAGCGFTPIHGDGGVDLQGRIEVAEPDNRDAFAFVSHMENRLGRASGAPLVMSYEIEISETGLAISGSNDITRFNVFGTINYAVTPVGSDAPVTGGTVDSFTAYSASGSTITTLAAKRDARARLMQILGDQIVTRLSVDPALR